MTVRDERSTRQFDDWYRCEWPRLVATFTLASGDRELGREIAAESLARVHRVELDRRARRQTRRRGWTRLTGVASLAALTVGIIAGSVRDRDQPRQLHTVSPPTAVRAMTGAVLAVDSGSDQLVLNDLDSGMTRTVTLPSKSGGDYPYDLLAVDGWIVYPGDGIRSIRADFSGTPLLLGRASWFVASARPGWVWLVTWTGGTAATTVEEVRVDGRERGSPRQVPAGMFAYIGVPSGLLVGNGSSWSVWNQASGKLGPPLFTGDNGLVDVHAELVAWALGCRTDSTCPSLRVVNVAAGTQHDFPAPEGTTGWIPTAGSGFRHAFSSDGRYVAVRAGGIVAPGANHPSDSEVYVVDLRLNQVTRLSTSRAGAFSRLVWSPDGRWVFFETASHGVGGYRPSDGATMSFPGTCCGVALATFPT